MKSAAEQLAPAPARALPEMVFDASELESPDRSLQTQVERGSRPRIKELPRESRLAQLSLSDVLVPASLLLLTFVAACAAFPATVAPYLPTDMHTDAILSAPGWPHLFGTDQFGRDVFSLVVYGARQSVLIGVFAVLISCSIGVSLGLVAGYAGGWLDTALMRVIDTWLAIPNILLAIALSTVLGPSLVNTIFAISITTIPRYARILRGQALSVRSRPFIEASRAAGASHFAILRKHVLPHCSVQIMVLATLGVGTSILIGSGLSFLGLGVNDERPDWGYLLTQGRGYLTVAWWTVTFPGLAITSLVVSINLLGDALRRRFDPRSAPR
ncbi:MAG TPA: ABC transporter permease [Polyangiaceae bacterium]|nr:ABC transporter permease [Polyangiaceae bacterium]